MSNQIEELEEMVQNMIISINSLEGENKDLREKNLALNDKIFALNEENDKIKKESSHLNKDNLFYQDRIVKSFKTSSYWFTRYCSLLNLIKTRVNKKKTSYGLLSFLRFIIDESDNSVLIFNNLYSNGKKKRDLDIKKTFQD